ncbi:hypothetical protein [Salidesulfovibrio brasiliensis]|uniref:hypothetical protein n=1 Tax=Salidesulfovibrio brasiliensis TaxID=221711 RepID=UPI0006D01F54|nr:hypothetical protein [Salidesulfovibrio brasiliensis]
MNGIERSVSIPTPVRRPEARQTEGDSIEAKLDRASRIVEAKIEARRKAAEAESMELGMAIGSAHALDADRVAALIEDPFPME